MKLSDNHYIYGGKTFRFEFYVTEAGKIPAFDYYESLSEAEQRRFFVVVTSIADAPIGTLFPKTIFNIEDKPNSIYAIKPSSQRFFSFMTSDRRIILTNAYRKHSQKMTKIDKEVLNASIRAKRDYDDRIKKGTYYE